MIKLKSNDDSQFSQLSMKSTNDQNSIQKESNQDHIETNQLKNQYINKVLNYQEQNENPQKAKCKDVCIMILICISVITLIFIVSIAINNMLSEDQNKQNGNKINKQEQIQTTKQSFSNKTIPSINMQNKVQNQNIQIQILKQKVNILQSSMLSIMNQIFLLKNKPDSKINQSSQFVNSNNLNQITQTTLNISPSNISNLNILSNQYSSTTQSVENVNNSINFTQFTLRQKQRNNIAPLLTKSHYQFNLSIDQIIDLSAIKYTYSLNQTQWNGINKPQFQRAIRLMQITHNINYKGQFIFDHFNNYQSAQHKFKTFSKLLQDQKQYYDKKYEISKYIHDQISICVNIPSYNNAKNRIYLRNLDSIFQQEYKNYHIVYVNDASVDGTGDYVQAYMEENQIPPEKYTIINHQKNKGSSYNIHMVAKDHCKSGQIMVLLDGDDALIGRQVFSLLNAIYQKQKVALTYGQFLMVRLNRITGGYARQIPIKYLQNQKFRQLKSFYSTHLKTMYSDVIKQIKQNDLQYPNGTFYDYASDVTLMTPAIELVGTRLKFIRELIYEYNHDTGMNDPHDKQAQIQQQIYQKAPYKKMENMNFADNPKTIHYS